MNEKQEINQDHYHEIIDRCHIINSMIDDFLIDRPGMTGMMNELCEESQSILCRVIYLASKGEDKFLNGQK